MIDNVKIYCVLFDSLPLTKNIITLAGKNEANIVRQIGACFTGASLIEMFTGKMLSDLHRHGIGYRLKEKFCYPDTKLTNWPWKKQILLYQLLEHNWKVKYHNGRHFCKYLLSEPAIEHHRLKIKEKDCLATSCAEGEEQMDKELKFIYEIQKNSISDNTFNLIYYEHYHQALYYYDHSYRDKKFREQEKKYKKRKKIAERRSLKLMNQWDFNEPNSIFWFFSDHGDWNLQPTMRHPLPQMYYSWVMVKDNTKNPIKVKSNFVSIRDFFPTIMNKFGYDYKGINDICSIDSDVDMDRIYFIEDGRATINRKKSTTAMACKLVDWRGNVPGAILQTSYHEPNRKWKSFLTPLKKGLFVGDSVSVKVEEGFKTIIKKRFDWVEN